MDGPAALVRALGEGSADLGFPIEQPACQSPEGLTPEARQVCGALLFSRPLFRTIRLFFTRQGSDFTFEEDGQVAGRIVCAPAAMDVQDLDADGRKWLSQDLLTLLRKDSLEACFAMLDSGEADAVYADEIEGQARLADLGLEDHILVVERPVATHSLHAAVSRNNPKAAEIVAAVDAGLASLERRGRYYELLARRLLVRTTDESAVR